MAEYEDWGSARIAQLEQQDLERYQRDVLRNSSYSYDDETPNHVDEFQSKLSVLLDMVCRLSSDLKRTTSAIENGSEPPTINLHSELTQEANDELHSDEELAVNEYPDSEEMLVFDDTKGIDSSNTEAPGVDDMVSEYGLQVFSIYCAHMASKWKSVLDSQPIQGNDISVEVYYDQFYNWKKQLEAASYIGDEQSYIDDFLWGLKRDLRMRVWGYPWNPQTLFGAFRRALIEENMMKNDAPMVFDKNAEQDEENDCILLGKVAAQVDAHMVFIEISKPVLGEDLLGIGITEAAHNMLYKRPVLSQVHLDEDSYGKYVSLSSFPYNIDSSSCDSASNWVAGPLTYIFRVIAQDLSYDNGVLRNSVTKFPILSTLGFNPQVFDPGTLKPSKQVEIENQMHCMNSEPFLNHSQVYAEFSAYNNLVSEFCYCLFKWSEGRDIIIDWVVSIWNSLDVLLWNCCVLSWRCTRPFDDFHVGALAQRCIIYDQPKLNNRHGISAGNDKAHFTAVGMSSQIVSCEDKYCFIGFNHFCMFESDSPTTFYLVYDSIAQRDSFSKSLFIGANSMLLRKFLYCWTLSLDKLTIELRFVMFCFDPGEFHCPQMGCDLLEFGGELGNCLGTTKVGVSSLRFNESCYDAGRCLNLTFDREHYNIFGQHLILYTLEDKGVLKRMGIGIYLASVQDHILSGASAHYYYARTRIMARSLVDGKIFSLLIASSIFRIRKSYNLKELFVSFRSVRLDCEDATDAMRFMYKDIKASPQFGLAFLNLGSEHYIWDPGSSAALMRGYRVDAFYNVITHGINGRDLCGICMRCKAESLLAIGKYFDTTSILMEVTTLTIFVFETKVVRGRVASLEYRGVFVILPSEKHSIQCYDLLLAFSLRSKSQYTLSGLVFMKSTVFGHMVRGFMCQHGAYNIAGLSLIVWITISKGIQKIYSCWIFWG